MEDYDFLSDVTVSKVFKGPSGESDHGPWQIWNFYVNGDDRKFSYFEKAGLIPSQGMRLKMLKFETVKKGKYTNYNVKEMFPDKSAKPSQTKQSAPQSTSVDREVSFYVSYAKDIICKLLEVDESLRQANVDQLGEIAARTGIKMLNIVSGKYDKPKPNTDPIDMPEFSDGTPIPEEPPDWA